MWPLYVFPTTRRVWQPWKWPGVVVKRLYVQCWSGIAQNKRGMSPLRWAGSCGFGNHWSGGHNYAHNTQVTRGVPPIRCTQIVYIHLCTHTNFRSKESRFTGGSLKMLERMFLKEQVKKREEHQKKEHHCPREERVGGEREKRSLLNRLRGHRDRPAQIIGTAQAPEK